MAFLRISDVYASIHKTLREDKVIRELMGFTEETTDIETALRIQKRMRPIDIVSDNLPLISFYKLPGYRGNNHLEYTSAFYFDVYTEDDVELAVDIVDRINELFDDEYLKLVKGSSFKAHYLTSAEDITDMRNTYKYYTQLQFTFGIEG